MSESQFKFSNISSTDSIVFFFQWCDMMCSLSKDINEICMFKVFSHFIVIVFPKVAFSLLISTF